MKKSKITRVLGIGLLLSVLFPFCCPVFIWGADGDLKWAFKITTRWGLHSSPAIGTDGIIYVTSYDGNLYAIEGGSGGLADSSWPMFHHDVRHTGNVNFDCLSTRKGLVPSITHLLLSDN